MSVARPLARFERCLHVWITWRRRRPRSRAPRLVIAWMVVAPLCSAQDFQQPDVLVPPAGGNLLVLEVRLDNYLVSDGLTAYQVGQRVLLPLGELSRLLTIAVKAEPARGTATGFVVTENRPFHLNLPAASVTVGDHVEPLDKRLAVAYPDDIYVASELVSRWMPLTLDIDYSSLVLRVTAREPLPLQRRLQREREASQARSPYRDADPGYPRHVSPYRLWEPPFIDHTLSFELARNRGAAQLTARHSTFLTGDLLGFESAIFIGGSSSDPIENVRATLGRSDPEARLLGPLRARAYAFGNVPVPGLLNVSRSSSIGTGVLLSNLPLTRPRTFRRQSFQGDLPPGWDVELYFNNALIAFQSSRPDGRYAFEDVPLVYGLNEFRLVFHGPQGQIRVERQEFMLQDTLTRPGEFQYHLAAHDADNGGRRAYAQLDYGLAGNLSITGGAVTLPLQGVDRSYSNLGLRAQTSGMFVTGDVVSSEGGVLTEVGLLTRVAGISVNVSHAEARQFTSELFAPAVDPVRSRDRLRIDGATRPHPALPLSYSAEFVSDRLRSGHHNLDLVGRVSTFVRGTSITNNFRWQSRVDVPTSAEGALNVSSRYGHMGVRGQINYSLHPERELTAVAVAANRVFGQQYTVNASIIRTFQTSDTRFSVSLTKTVGSFGYGIGATYGTRGETVITGQLFVALGREPRRAAWVTDALPLADSGAVSARVFVDRNLNGVMDPGEEPIAGAALLVNGGRHPARTDAEGIAYLRRLPVKEPLDVAVDASTLEDPQWAPVPAGIRVVARPGKAEPLDFPVVLAAEIDGTVYLQDAKGKQPLANLTVELVDAKGSVVAQTRSAPDGFFLFSTVKPGAYHVRLAEADLVRTGLPNPGSRALTVKADGTAPSVDLPLTRPQSPAGAETPR